MSCGSITSGIVTSNANLFSGLPDDHIWVQGISTEPVIHITMTFPIAENIRSSFPSSIEMQVVSLPVICLSWVVGDNKAALWSRSWQASRKQLRCY